jgi:N-acetylneuraminic acid mutarotase
MKETLPDDEGNYPEVRKGHSLVGYGSKVYIFGGLHYPNDQNDPENILDDIWILDLTDFKWKKSENTLPEAVFFHSADITSVSHWTICFIYF